MAGARKNPPRRKREMKPFVPPPPFEATAAFRREWCPGADARTNRLISWYLRLAVCVPYNTRALDDPKLRPVRELAIEFLNREFGTTLAFAEEADAITTSASHATTPTLAGP